MEELASLAFYKAIDDYFGEHKGIGRADVEKIVDTAIANSHKLGRKLSGLFSSNKNDDGLYILIESDFIFNTGKDVKMENLQLAKIANQVRKDIVTGVYNAKSGHPGGSLSAADMLTFLYFEEMNVSPEKAKDSNRDRFVLSKGHVAPALYSVLAEKDIFQEKISKH